MKKKMLVVLGMTAFLLSGCMGKEEIVQTEQLEVSEMTEVQEMFVTEAVTVENTEAFIHGTENGEDNETVYSENEISGDGNEETDEETKVHTDAAGPDAAGPDAADRSYIKSTEYVENPNNLPVLTGNEIEEGLYWDPEWQHETYVEFGPDEDVYFDKYGNAYSCPVDSEGNLIIE